ncbi:two-component system sensor histidine kinase KdpD [Caldicoprobacter guelmensis]|uniref:sensor histidine kinase n=1 Tax=Caldicoprobacter guelmensis TaxID=1170224 RepID=UPI00195BCDD4|nr:sensor histidine kinase KdpD [Caldicoprobacter guelmensis]MBM7583315.1 two-component system sensor histidine kinase KdpD [Caldicoprobacter guelmensis]
MEREVRPDPEKLLEKITDDKRGKLTIFLGPAAGVGKTFAMLSAAHERKSKGIDVVIGWVDTHKRPDTEKLVEGLEVIPPKKIVYKGTVFEEMDVDAIIARRPMIVLVDELAHTNVPGSRHHKRYQDVEEILDNGIDVFTTLNIQHIESLNDVVAQITGVVVRETVPDRILEQASEIRLIDLSSDELIQRLKEGKVYVPEQADKALKNFFRKGNIEALRELALRRTAERIDKQLDEYMKAHDIRGPWPVKERIMVCISPSPLSANLIRFAGRMANRLEAEFYAVYVERPEGLNDEKLQQRLRKNLSLAENLGAQTVILTGSDPAKEIIDFARSKNITQIVIGKPLRFKLIDICKGSLVDRILRLSRGISVHIITGEVDQDERSWTQKYKEMTQKVSLMPFIKSVIIVAAFTFLCKMAEKILNTADLTLIYQIPVLISATRSGLLSGIFTAFVSALALNFFFIPPLRTFSVANVGYVLNLIMFMITAIIISSLISRLTKIAEASQKREARTAAMYRLSRNIAATADTNYLLEMVTREICNIFHADTMILRPDDKGKLRMDFYATSDRNEEKDVGVLQSNGANSFCFGEKERATATWVYEHGEKAGFGTDTLSDAKAVYIPLKTQKSTFGVLGVKFEREDRYLTPDEWQLLDAFAGLAAIAVERICLSEEAKKAEILAKTEQLRVALLDSVSHELRTPLSSIIGAATTLLEEEGLYDKEVRRNMLSTILNSAKRMNIVVENLLGMTRIESGNLRLRLDWCALEDIIGSALTRLKDRLEGRLVNVDVDSNLPLIYVDFVLMEQVMINLLDNAIKYSPKGSPITIRAKPLGKTVEIEVEDEGIGIPEEDLERIFDKFYRAETSQHVSGTGVGLSICKGIVEAHGGKIKAENREGKGARFSISLPISAVQQERPEGLLGDDK